MVHLAEHGLNKRQTFRLSYTASGLNTMTEFKSREVLLEHIKHPCRQYLSNGYLVDIYG